MKAVDFRPKNFINVVADAGNGSPTTGANPMAEKDLKKYENLNIYFW